MYIYIYRVLLFFVYVKYSNERVLVFLHFLVCLGPWMASFMTQRSAGQQAMSPVVETCHALSTFWGGGYPKILTRIP